MLWQFSDINIPQGSAATHLTVVEYLINTFLDIHC